MLINANDLLNAVLEYQKTAYWQFKPCGTALQCDKTANGYNWYLADFDDGTEPYYYIGIEKSAQSIVDVIAHLEEKNWVDIGDVVVALMPAIRSIRG